MKLRLSTLLFATLLHAPAHAQDAPTQEELEAAREADIFGTAPAPEPASEPVDAGEEPAETESSTPDSEVDREAEMFGGSAETDREADLFGGASTPTPSEPTATDVADRIAGKIAKQDDTLAIGGRLFLQMQGSLNEDSDGLDDVALSSPNLLDLFADARPNDRVRAYVRGRLRHDWTVHQTITDATGAEIDAVTGEPVAPSLFGSGANTNQVLLDQLWVKFDIGRKVYTTAGRQRIKWGAGRFWNPTDFLNQQRLDPLAVLDLRTGVSLVKLHIPFEAAGANVYAIANLDQANALDQIGGAARVEWLLGQTEFTLSSALRKDQPVRLGADLSSGISILDVRLEAALLHGNAETSWRGSWDYQSFPPTFPTERNRDDDWIAQVVAGADFSIRYSDQDSITLGGEYFYNDAGYDDADLIPWLFFAGGYNPLYVGKHYVAAYALLAGPGQWDDHSFTASFIGNLSDRSQIARLDYRGNTLTWLDVNLFVSESFGNNGELHYRLNLPPMPADLAAVCSLDPECAPFAEALADRIRSPAPTLTVGGGASVRF